MSEAFRAKVREKLADENLRTALSTNAERRLRLRAQAFASLPDIPERRLRAQEVCAGVVAHLDSYLEQFIQHVQANGILVHRAADAVEAVNLVLQIARQHQAHLIAKSKTMVSEEIHLNRVLEAAGIKVVETDLGEYIVQLRGEAPAHVTTPAVHLRREQVGQTFHEKLGIPYTDDIPTLTAAARQVLREVFLSAEVGISGVNFGVVEDGLLCVLTNEGNGRMVTTLPPVHIALMGIERMLPTRDDLALMLSLLPRFSTGQKMTVYTSLIYRPRQAGDPDGAQERHLVLVDNGRSALRGSALEEALYCIRCGSCLNVCPVFREIGGHAYVGIDGKGSTYSGPIGSIVSPALFGVMEYGHLARASSLCGACREACPVDIDLPRLLLRVRAGGKTLETSRTPPGVPGYLNWGLRLFGWAAASPARFHLAQRAAGLFGRFVAPFSSWIRLPASTGWGYSKDFPRPALRPFREHFKEMRRNGKVNQQPGELTEVKSLPSAQPVDLLEAPQADERLSQRFASELEAVGGRVVHCGRGELAGRLLAELAAQGIHELMAWDQEHLPSGLCQELKNAGLRLLDAPSKECRAGLTGALAGVAETGTLALAGGPGRMLSASLLPELHLALLSEDAIRATLSEVLALPELRQAAAAVLVTGPSRTGDIEMTLTIGVHGPRELVVFIFSGE